MHKGQAAVAAKVAEKRKSKRKRKFKTFANAENSPLFD